MFLNPNETIFPCPFSKGYGIPAQQAWSLLKVFLVYRFVLASLFLILFYGHYGLSLLGSHNRLLYVYTSRIYLGLSILSGICLVRQLAGYTTQAQLLIFSDIIILTLLMHACGGVGSGMGMLLAVSVAYGGLLIGGRCALVFAAIASVAILIEQSYAADTRSFELGSFSHAGMLGAAFFTIAFLSHILAKRSEQIVRLANKQQQTIANLEELNQYIIQHLESGIIITNRHQAIHMANEAALRLANLTGLPVTLADISGQLAECFDNWLNDIGQDFLLLQRADQPAIQIRFSLLPAGHEFSYMILMEDLGLYNQRLQQSKLASLGRLTASIAHEIRNPLSAISHASELLAESPQLSNQDQRLGAIIKDHSRRVNKIIEDILQLSRRKNSRREKFLLVPWLKKYLQNFLQENQLPENAIAFFHSQEDLRILMDSNHLTQILDNLCRNAFTYGRPEQGAIMVRCYLLEQSPCIDISDHGSGVSTENLSLLFEPFFTTSSNGTGLGLFISKELAELNQAKLSYHATAGQPALFRLCLLNAEQTLIEI